MANIGFETFNYGDTIRSAQGTRNLRSREKLLDQAGQENEQNQQLKNTVLLHKGALSVVKDPSLAQSIIDQWKKQGVVDPDHVYDLSDPKKVQSDFYGIVQKTAPFQPKGESPWSKPDRDNYTQESSLAFEQSGNQSDLIPNPEGDGDAAGFSANSEIIGNYVIQSDNQGGVRVTDLNGTPVTGPEATKAIMGAREAKKKRSIDIKVEGSKLEIANKNRIGRSEAAYDKVEKLRENNRNLRQAANSIADGADTGYIANLFPSFRKSTIELENAANRLGLDVVGAVTFGALSAGELKMAMATAIPMDMDEPELKQWLLDRIDAQEKLIGYFNEYAGYMSTEGNTVAKWNEKVESMGKYKENPVDTPPGSFKETYEQRRTRVLGQ
jgi:hypothetical protein